MCSSHLEADFSPGSDESDIDDELSLYLTAGESLTPVVKLTEGTEFKQEKTDQLQQEHKEIQDPEIATEGSSDHESNAVSEKRNLFEDNLLLNEEANKICKSDTKTYDHGKEEVPYDLNSSRDLASDKKVTLLSIKTVNDDSLSSNDCSKAQWRSLAMQQHNKFASENKNHKIEKEKLVKTSETLFIDKQGSSNINSVKSINKEAENDESENFDETDDELLYYLSSGEISQPKKNSDTNSISMVGDSKQSECMVKENITASKQKEHECGKDQMEKIIKQQNLCIARENKKHEVENTKLVKNFETKDMVEQDISLINSVGSIKKDKNSESETYNDHLTAGETLQLSRKSYIVSAADVLIQNKKLCELKKDTVQNLFETTNKTVKCKNDEGSDINRYKTPWQAAVQSNEIISNEPDEESVNGQDNMEIFYGSGLGKCHFGIEEVTNMNNNVMDESLEDGDPSHSSSAVATYHSSDVKIDTAFSQASCFVKQQNHLTETAEVNTIYTCENSESRKENGSTELCMDENIAEHQSKDSEISLSKHIQLPLFQSYDNMEDKGKGYNKDITILSHKIHELHGIRKSKVTRRKDGRSKKEIKKRLNKPLISSLSKKRDCDLVTVKNEKSQYSTCKEETGNDKKIIDTNNYDDTDSIDDPLESYLTGKLEDIKAGITQTDKPDGSASSCQTITNEKVAGRPFDSFQKITSINNDRMLLEKSTYNDCDGDDDDIDDPLASYLGSDVISQKEVTLTNETLTSITFEKLKTNENQKKNSYDQLPEASSNHDVSTQIHSEEEMGIMKIPECVEGDKTFDILKSASSKQNFCNSDYIENKVSSNNVPNQNKNWIKDSHFKGAETLDYKNKSKSPCKDYLSKTELQMYEQYPEFKQQLKQEKISNYSPIKQRDIESLKKMFDYSSVGFSEQITIKSPSEIVTEPHSDMDEHNSESRSVVEITIINAEETGSEMSTKHTTSDSNSYIKDTLHKNIKANNSDDNSEACKDVKQLMVEHNSDKAEATAISDKLLNHSSYGEDIEHSFSEDRNDRVFDSHGSGKSGDKRKLNETVSGVSTAKLNGTGDNFKQSEYHDTKPGKLPQLPGRFIRKNNKLYLLKVINGKHVAEEFMSSKSKKVPDEKVLPMQMQSMSGSRAALGNKPMHRENDQGVFYVDKQKSSKQPVSNKMNQTTGVSINNTFVKVSSTNSCAKTATSSEATDQTNFLIDNIQKPEGLKSAVDDVRSEYVNELNCASSKLSIYKHSDNSSSTHFQKDSQIALDKNAKGTATIRVFRVEQSPNKMGLVKKKFIILQDDGRYHEIESTEPYENPLNSQHCDQHTDVLIPNTEMDTPTERFISDVETGSGTKSKVVKPIADVATQSQVSYLTCKCMCKSVLFSSTEQEKQMLKMKRHRQRIRNLKALVQMKNSLKSNKLKAVSASKSGSPCMNDKQSTETHREELDRQQPEHVKKENDISGDNSLSVTEMYSLDKEASVRHLKSDLLKDTTGSERKRKTDKSEETNTGTSFSQTSCLDQEASGKQHKNVLEKNTVDLKRKIDQNMLTDSKKSSLPKRATLEAKFSVQGERELKNLIIDMKHENRSIDFDSILNNEMPSEKDCVQTRRMRGRMRESKETAQSYNNEEKGYATVTKGTNSSKHTKVKSKSKAVSAMREVKCLAMDKKHNINNMGAKIEMNDKSEPVKPSQIEKQDTPSNASKTVSEAMTIEDAKKKESLKVKGKCRKQLVNRSSGIKLELNRTCSPGSSMIQMSDRLCGSSAHDQILEKEMESDSKRKNRKPLELKCNNGNQRFRPNIATAMEECLQEIRRKQSVELDSAVNSSSSAKIRSNNDTDVICGHAGSSKAKKIGRDYDSYLTKSVDNERQLCDKCGNFVTPYSEMTDCMHENISAEVAHSEKHLCSICGNFVTPYSEMTDCMHENIFAEAGHSGSDAEQDYGKRSGIKDNDNSMNSKVSVSRDKTVDGCKTKKMSTVIRKVRFKEPSSTSRKESTLKRNVRDLTENKGSGTCVKKIRLSRRGSRCISTTGSENDAQTGVTKNLTIKKCKSKVALKPKRKTKGTKSGEIKGHCSKEITVGGQGIGIQIENERNLMDDTQVIVKEADDIETLSWNGPILATGQQNQNINEGLAKLHKNVDIKKKYSKIQAKRKHDRNKKEKKMLPRGRKKKVVPLGFNYYHGKGKLGVEGWKNLLYDKAFHFHDIIQKQRKPDVKHFKRLLGRVFRKTKTTDLEKLKKHKSKTKVGTTSEQGLQDSATHQVQSCQFQSFHFSPKKGEIGSTPEYPIEVENQILTFYKHGVTDRVKQVTIWNEPMSVERNGPAPHVGRALFGAQNEEPSKQLGVHRFPASHLYNLSVRQMLGKTKLQKNSQASEDELDQTDKASL